MTKTKGKIGAKTKYPLMFVEDKNDLKHKNEQYEEAWQEAKRASQLLKNDFCANKVIVFGSLVDKSRFHLNSDIDIAIQGIPDEKFYAAVAAVTRLITDFKVDLIDIDFCRKSIKKSIIKEGIEI